VARPTRGESDGDLPDAAAIAERLREYRLDRFAKELRPLPETAQDITFAPDDRDLRQFYVRAPVESLDDLKLWTGIPNDHIDHSDHTGHLRCVTVPALETVKRGQLDPQVVADAEHNLRFGYVDDKLLSNAFWKLIADGLLERWRTVNVLLAQDLDVLDGQTVTLSNTQTAFFRKVTVYGSGVLSLQDDCKIIADTVEHVASP
jgi:hypothetical protein